MSVSFASVAPVNLELTPMRVTYKGVDLGATLGNCSLSIEIAKAELKADQYGETVLDRRVSGHKFTISTELAEVRLKDNWKIVFPHMDLVTSGGNKAGYFASKIGLADSASAGILILHPLALPDSDKSGDYKIYLAVSDEKSEVVYGPGEQVKLKMVWNVLPDFSVQPARFIFHGDPTIGLIAASAGSPSYSGTGGGTLGSVSVFSGASVTETITATCVTASAGAGVFNVNGSVSGPLGLATVGVAFSSSKIAFTISDGTPDFIVGDQFTIAVTAANYV